MKKYSVLLMAALLSTSAVSTVYAVASSTDAQAQTSAVTAAPAPAEKSNMNDVSYVIGYQIGNGIKTQKMNIDPTALKDGLNSALGGEKAKFNQVQMQTIMENFQKEMMAKAAASLQAKAAAALK